MVQVTGDNKAKRVSAMFARISGRYDFMNTVMTWGMHNRWRRLAAALATRELPPGIALDVATGTGDLAFELTRRPEVSSVVGMDMVAEMLALAQAKEEEIHPRRPVTWSRGDALKLPFADNTFMCVTIGFGLRNVADIRQAISEMVRVVRPGGRVVILELTPSARRRPVSRVLAVSFSFIAPVLGHFLAGDRDAYTYLPQSVESFPTASELSLLMQEKGLINVNWQMMGMGLVALHVGEVTCPPKN